MTKEDLIKDMIEEELITTALSQLPTEKDIQKNRVIIPKTKYQELLVDFFNILKSADSPDSFDTYARSIVKDKKLANRFIDFLTKILTILHLHIEDINDKEKFIARHLFKLAERKLEENEATINIVEKLINEEVKEGILVGEEIPEIDIKRLKDETIKDIKEQVKNLNFEDYKEKITQIENTIRRIKDTNLELLAKKLNDIVDIGYDAWVLQLLSCLSPYAPTLIINGVPQRKTIHSLLVGDISTGKSTILKILEVIAPKAKPFSRITEASFEGIVKGDEFQNHLFDRDNPNNINDGTLLVNEFDKFKENIILKEIMDNGTLNFAKKGIVGVTDINMSMICCANPKTEFFRKELLLRQQIEEKESILSRFDAIIPFANTSQKINTLLDDVVLFGGKPASFNFYEDTILIDIAKIMKKVKSVKINSEQEQFIKQSIKRHIKDLETRPLILLRDVEIFARFLNTLATFNACVRNPENVPIEINVTDDDIRIALKLWEYLIDLRTTLYTQQTRYIKDIKEKIMIEILNSNGQVDSAKLQKKFEMQGICGHTTFYSKLNDLIYENKIRKVGQQIQIPNAERGVEK